MVKNLKELLENGIDLVDQIYNLALSENFEKGRIQYTVLSKNINDIYLMMINEGYHTTTTLVEQMEKIYAALSVGDSIGIMDIAGFEMKPILQKYIESIGE